MTAVGESGGAPSPAAVPPLVGRLAGLSARLLEELRSPDAETLLAAREEVAGRLDEARKALAPAIGEALAEFEPAARRLLLAVKRSCFNGRKIGPFRDRPDWAALLRIAAPLAERIVTLEEELDALDRDLAGLYASELVRERRHLLAIAEDPKFLRGLAIGRPGLVEKLRVQAPALRASDFAKPPAKWEESLLRFVTRAAAKLSANSTLSTYAQGSIDSSPQARGVRFDRVPTGEVSLVRLDRQQAEQLQELLLHHPAVRDQAQVGWNESAEEIEPGRFRLLRAGCWKLEPEAIHFQHCPPVKIRITPRSPLLGALRETLASGPLRYGELLQRLKAAGESAVRADLDHLIEMGLLRLLPPWPTHEPWLEQRASRLLSDLAEHEPAVREIAAALAELVALEETYAAAPRAEIRVREMEKAFSRLMQKVAPLVGHRGRLETAAHFYEDVLTESTAEPEEDGAVFSVATATIEEIQRVAGLVSRFDAVFNLRHDVLHTLAAWWRERMPDRRQVSFEEVAAGFATLWSAFLEFFESAKKSAVDTFDPLGSPGLAALRELRERLLASALDQVGRSPGQDFISASALAELLEIVPRRYGSLVGSSVFIQPADAACSTWVLNNVTEGTGRYLSRLMPVLPEARRERLLEHLVARSTIEVEGEEADLLEVKHPFIHLVCAHPPQARKVLEPRGQRLDLPPERKVALGELVVEADLEAETFRLLDRRGRRVLPASLSTMSEASLPNGLRFLLMFGPGQSRGVFPFAWSTGSGEVVSHYRLRCENVTTRRRAWTIEVAALRESLAGVSDREAYVLVDRWRRRLGFPAEGYYLEMASCGRSKPQLVRFASPSLCRLFVAALSKLEKSLLHFVESRPSADDFPPDALLEPRGFELLIDTLAIRNLDGIPPRDG